MRKAIESLDSLRTWAEAAAASGSEQANQILLIQINHACEDEFAVLNLPPLLVVLSWLSASTVTATKPLLMEGNSHSISVYSACPMRALPDGG